jgi:hypothetical protein
LTFAFIVQFLLPNKRVGKATVLYICIQECFWNLDGFKIVLIISVSFKKYEIVTFISFSLSLWHRVSEVPVIESAGVYYFIITILRVTGSRSQIARSFQYLVDLIILL